MNERVLTKDDIQSFVGHLHREEKSRATIEKYLRDVQAFFRFAGKTPITKELVIGFKSDLLEKGYAVRSINSMLASLNSLLTFLGLADCKVKNIRQQRQTYCPEEQELTKAEYFRLLKAAENQPKLRLIMQTICGTGIRVSELRHFTVEAVRRGEVIIQCKGKTRTILVPGKLKKLLLCYAEKCKVRQGVIFRTRSGKPLDRSRIWAQMKHLCGKAGVNPSKVFPHNLRKLFARTFYSVKKDIAKLADVLGHSSINTTRLYIMTTGSEHRRQIESLGLIL